MTPHTAAKTALEKVREILSKTEGSELEVLRVFVDYIGAEIDGWTMRIEELEAEE